MGDEAIFFLEMQWSHTGWKKVVRDFQNSTGHSPEQCDLIRKFIPPLYRRPRDLARSLQPELSCRPLLL